MKEEKFPNWRKTSHWRVCGEFWNLKWQHNREKRKKKKKKERKPQITHLTTTPSREIAQTLGSTSSELGLNRKARADCLG